MRMMVLMIVHITSADERRANNEHYEKQLLRAQTKAQIHFFHHLE
jgi:hypothetical protein